MSPAASSNLWNDQDQLKSPKHHIILFTLPASRASAGGECDFWTAFVRRKTWWDFCQCNHHQPQRHNEDEYDDGGDGDDDDDDDASQAPPHSAPFSALYSTHIAPPQGDTSPSSTSSPSSSASSPSPSSSTMCYYHDHDLLKTTATSNWQGWLNQASHCWTRGLVKQIVFLQLCNF